MIEVSCEIVAVLFLFAMLDHYVRPKCDRHGKRVMVARVPGLGCWDCVHEDVEEYHRDHPRGGE